MTDASKTDDYATMLDGATKKYACDALIIAVMRRIAQMEAELGTTASVMSDSNRDFYLQAQNRALQHWRTLQKFVEAHGKPAMKVEDGAFVKVSKTYRGSEGGNESLLWLYVHPLKTSLDVSGTTVHFTDGSLGRSGCTILGMLQGNSIFMHGDDRGTPGATVSILHIL